MMNSNEKFEIYIEGIYSAMNIVDDWFDNHRSLGLSSEVGVGQAVSGIKKDMKKEIDRIQRAQYLKDILKDMDEVNKRNAEIPDWMLHDKSVKGYMIDTRFVIDYQCYETMAWTAEDIENDFYGNPVF